MFYVLTFVRYFVVNIIITYPRRLMHLLTLIKLKLDSRYLLVVQFAREKLGIIGMRKLARGHEKVYELVIQVFKITVLINTTI